jgi:cytochrome c peroxidase
VPAFFEPIKPLSAPVIENVSKARLGQRLFNDVRLSADGSMSCASCHDLSSGGDDGLQVSVGINGQVGYLNTPTVLNASLNFVQFWDGRAGSLEEQIDLTVTNPAEMGGQWDEIERKLGIDSSMLNAFSKIFDERPARAQIVDALATYLRVLVTPNAPIDLFLMGDSDALSGSQRAGYALFKQYGCVSCHQGRGIGGNFFQRLGVMDDYFKDRQRTTAADLGRYNVTGREEDRYKFKVPGLRNVAETAPYLHDGSAQTLKDVVRIMVEVQLGRTATDEEVATLVSFLEALTGDVEETWL